MLWRNLRAGALLPGALVAIALAVAARPDQLPHALAGAGVVRATQTQGAAARARVGSPPQPSQAVRPASVGPGASQVHRTAGGSTAGVLVLTAAGQPLRANLPAGAAKGSLPGPGHSLGHGSTLLRGLLLEFQFAAQGDPFDAQGHASFTYPGFIDSKGPVDCLDVIGTRAYLSGPLERQVIPGYSRWILYMEDNDLADKESGTPDRIGLAIAVASPLPDCNNPSFQSVLSTSAFPFSKGKVEADQGK